MKYISDLPEGGQISIQNDGGQTRISLESSGEGQQQSQANSFSTGDWKGQPTLFKTSDGPVLQVQAEQGRFFFAIKGNSIQSLEGEPSLQNAGKLPLQEAPDDKAPGMKPMKPMEPMKPMS